MTLTKLVNGVKINLTPKEEADIKDEWESNEKDREKYDLEFGYIDKRRKEYPHLHKQMEAICAQFQKMKDEGLELHPVTDSWLTSIESIRNRHPKKIL